MKKTRRTHSAGFKAKIALSAAKGEHTMAELSEQYQVHPNQILSWKKHLVANIGQLFVRGSVVAGEAARYFKSLQGKTDRLAKDKEFLLQNIVTLSVSGHRAMISREADMPISQQYQLLGVARSTIYYRPVGISAQNQRLMRLIDETHLELPFFGSRNIQDMLRDNHCLSISRNRVRLLMREWDWPPSTRNRVLASRARGTRLTHTCCAA